MMRIFAILFSLTVLASLASPPLPELVQKDQPGLTLQSQSPYRFFGLKVYDIRLWAQGARYDAAQPHALELVYDMNLKGEDIAKRSITEMRGQGYGPEDKLGRWNAAMAKIFPDIKPGDTLIGVHVPGKEVRFYTRDKFITAVTDAEFARAFFDIWLAERTSEPGLRKRLLEQK